MILSWYYHHDSIMILSSWFYHDTIMILSWYYHTAVLFFPMCFSTSSFVRHVWTPLIGDMQNVENRQLRKRSKWLSCTKENIKHECVRGHLRFVETCFELQKDWVWILAVCVLFQYRDACSIPRLGSNKSSQEPGKVARKDRACDMWGMCLKNVLCVSVQWRYDTVTIERIEVVYYNICLSIILRSQHVLEMSSESWRKTWKIWPTLLRGTTHPMAAMDLFSFLQGQST